MNNMAYKSSRWTFILRTMQNDYVCAYFGNYFKHLETWHVARGHFIKR